jgi:hypothetical protein
MMCLVAFNHHKRSASHLPPTISASPGHGGIVIATAANGSAPMGIVGEVSAHIPPPPPPPPPTYRPPRLLAVLSYGPFWEATFGSPCAVQPHVLRLRTARAAKIIFFIGVAHSQYIARFRAGRRSCKAWWTSRPPSFLLVQWRPAISTTVPATAS